MKSNPKQQANFRARVAIFVTVLLGFISYSLPYPIFSPMFLSNEHGILPSYYSTLARTMILGAAFVMYPIGQFIGSPLIGRASDKHGRRKVLMITLLATGIGDLFVGVGIAYHEVWLVLLSLFIGGFWAGNIAIAQSAAANLSTAKTKAKNFGMLNMATNGGWIVGCLIGGKLADSTLVSWFNYATPFYFSAICYVFNLVLVFYAFPQDSKIQASASKEKFITSLFSQFKKLHLAILYLYSFLGFWASYFFFCFFAVFLVQKYNYGPSQLAYFEAYLALPLIAANYLLPKITAGFGLTKTSALSCFALALSLIVFIIPTSSLGLWFTVPVVALWLTFVEVTSGLLVSNAVSQAEQGAAMGTYRSILVLGEIVAALSGGYLAGLHETFPFIGGAIVAGLAGLVLIWFHFSRHSGI